MKRRNDHKSRKGIFKSFYVKIVAVFSVTIILASIFIGVAYSNTIKAYLSDTKLTDMKKAVDAISYLMVKYAQSDEYGHIQSGNAAPDSNYYILRSRMAACHEILNADVYISDQQGNIMMSFPLLPGEKDYIVRDTVYFSQDFASRFLYTQGSGYSFVNPSQYNECFKSDNFVVDYGDFYGFYTEEEGSHLTVSKRIVSYQQENVEVFGAVIMSFPMPELADAQKTIMNYVIIVTVIALAVEMLVMLFVTRYLIRPLKHLKKGAETMAGGNFNVHIEKTTNDEIGDLVDAFNTAAKSLNNLDTVRNDFIANVSHELRTPMTSIKGFVEAILDGVIPAEKQHEYLKKVHREITRMNGLVNDLLDWARLSAGKGNFHMAEFDINRTVYTVIANLEPLILQKNIEIVTDFEHAQETVYGDSSALERVLINLIQNAVKFTPENGKITVSTARCKGENKIQVAVTDSGIGMTEEEQAFIFDRFYKADKSRSSDKKGTGLGLSIAQKILQNHNQNITVSSKKGEGSCFTFTLDREAPHEEN